MRAPMLLIAILLLACTDPIGRNGPPVPPRRIPPPPPVRTDVIHEIDSAMDAAEAEEKLYNDPTFLERLHDSLASARKDSLRERLMREEGKKERAK